jgi:hypothetical protein
LPDETTNSVLSNPTVQPTNTTTIIIFKIPIQPKEVIDLECVRNLAIVSLEWGR